MVQALVELDEYTNSALNVVKARFGLKDKAAAIQIVVKNYMDEHEPPLRPEFVEKMRRIQKQKSIKVNDLASYFEAKYVRTKSETRTAKTPQQAIHKK